MRRVAPLAGAGAALLLLLAGGLGRPTPAEAGRALAGAQFRYWSFSNDNDLRDWIGYWASGPFHVQLEYWNFTRGNDQFRPEIGLHLRDRRRSVYTLQWRHERYAERLWFETEQILAGGWVARAGTSPILIEDADNETVYYAGADYYWGSYHFASANVIRDPRDGGLWVFPWRVRLATEANNWIQATLAPASERTVGWALDLKFRWVRLGVERNSRYDFTTLDNTIVTVGGEIPLPEWP